MPLNKSIADSVSSWGDYDYRDQIYKAIKDDPLTGSIVPKEETRGILTTYDRYITNLSYLALCYSSLKNEDDKLKFLDFVLKHMNTTVDIWSDSDHLSNNEIEELDEKMGYTISYRPLFDCFASRLMNEHNSVVINFCIANNYPINYQLFVSDLFLNGHAQNDLIKLFDHFGDTYRQDLINSGVDHLIYCGDLNLEFSMYLVKKFQLSSNLETLEYSLDFLDKDLLELLISNYKKTPESIAHKAEIDAYCEKLSKRGY